MAYTKEKETALVLRKEGMSIQDIANKLNLSKSTVSLWCRNILLSPLQIQRLQEKQKNASMKALMLYYEKNRKDRLERIEVATKLGKMDVVNFNNRDLFITGLSLYWAEGYKKGNEEVGFTNSDPEMLKIMIRWFKEIYHIKKEDFVMRVSINKVHTDRIQKVIEYWSQTLDTPVTQFTNTSLIQVNSKKVYTSSETYYGTLRIKVRRGTNLRRRILGSIEQLKSFTTKT